MALTKRYAKKQAKARLRRLKARERLERDRRQAQHVAEALQQALDDLGLPDDLVTEIEGRLRSQHKLLGKIVGIMFPPLFGCRTNTELCRVRGWEKNLPSRLLGALPKRSWLKRLRRLGLEVLIPLWRHAAHASAATRSRWQWTWVGDDSVFKKYGEQLGLVGTWWSGQEHRVLSGIDGVLLVVVVGEGKLIVPVDFAIRRPDPTGPGGPCRDKLHWVQGMLDGRVAAFRRRGVALPPPLVVADSWFSDSKLMRHVAMTHQGTFLVEGKSTYVFTLPDGRQVKGDDLQQQRDWSWRHSPQVPGMRYARLRATSPTYGVWGLIGGAIIAMIIGFVWGGWTTTRTTTRLGDEAVLAARAAICVAQFMQQPNPQEKLQALEKVYSYDRMNIITKGGWDKMPGEEQGNFAVARACADGLEVLMKK